MRPLQRVFTVAILSVLLLLSLVPQTKADVSLKLDQCDQEQTQWCWAAVSQCVLRFYDYDLTQSTIAAYGTEGSNEWNWLYGQTTNPTRRGINMILMYFAGLNSKIYDYALSAASTEVFMQEKRPVFIRWGWDSGGGHFVVPKAISGSNWTLMDPYYGSTINAYSWVVSGSGHTWTHSLSVDAGATPPSENPATISYPARDRDGSFTVTWPAVSNATSYTLERSMNIEFSDTLSIYNGSALQYKQSRLEIGTYYYRVRANNRFGSGPWRTGNHACIVTDKVSIAPIFNLLLGQ